MRILTAIKNAFEAIGDWFLGVFSGRQVIYSIHDKDKELVTAVPSRKIALAAVARLQYFDAFGWYYTWCLAKGLKPAEIGFDKPSWIEYWGSKETPMKTYYLSRIRMTRDVASELVRRGLGCEPLGLDYEDSEELPTYMIRNLKIDKASFDLSERSSRLYTKDPDYTQWMREGMKKVGLSDAESDKPEKTGE